MAAVSAVIGAVGLGLAAYGTYQNYSNSQNAAASNAAAAAKQAEIAGLQAQNVDVQKQQLDLQSSQQKLQTTTQRAVISDQQEADRIRLTAAELDATRRRRESVRAGIVARANSLTAATNSGNNQPGSTGASQAAATIFGQANTNVTGVTQNLDFGRKLYDINRDISSQYLAASYQNDSFVDQSKGLQTQVLNRQKDIYRLGGDASSNYAQAAISQGNAATGAGMMSFGGQIVGNYDKINSLTNYFAGKFGSSPQQDYSNFTQPTDI